jgi:hypothetical protein
MLVPTRKGYPLCVVHMGFLSAWSLAPEEEHCKHCFTTPDSFTAEGGIPLQDSWSDFQREMFVGSTGKETTMSSRGQVLAQNSHLEVFFNDGEGSSSPSSAGGETKVQIFTTGDPDAKTHWLQQVRIAAHWNGNGKPRSVSAQSRLSVPSVTTVVTYHSCDRMSCLGCGSLRLQALCYAAQQCSVVQCIGTVVNQNRPLCNIGLMLKSYTESMLSTTLGAWLIFTETYSSILDVALMGPSEGFSAEWVDDAFFGYICTAKDMLGQATGILTSSMGAAIMTSEKKVRAMAEEEDFIQGALKHDISDDAFTAWATMSLSGINSFLYQLTMLPLYMLIAMQKTVVCTTKDVFGIFDITGFFVSIGRGDLQAASSVSSGMCLTRVSALCETYAPETVAQSADDLMRSMGNLGSTIIVEQDALKNEGARAKRYLDLLGGNKNKQARLVLERINQNKAGRKVAGAANSAARGLESLAGKISSSGEKMSQSQMNSVSRGGASRSKTFYDAFTDTKVVKRIGGLMSKMQLKMPVHLVDSMITYAIGIVSGVQDMVQVYRTPRAFVFLWLRGLLPTASL